MKSWAGHAAAAASTKFQVPPYDTELIRRERLIEVLRQGQHGRLTLIHGPAGYGKTTLAVQWQRLLQAEGAAVAWLSLDRDDNNSVGFLGHLIEAVRRGVPTLANELGGVLEGSPDDAQRYVLTELVNQISDYRRQLTVVLDDWHVIDDPQTVAALEFLLNVGPSNLHFVVVSRARTLTIGRMKVQNQVTEVDSALLRFGQRECAAFLVDLNKLSLDDDAVERLRCSTEGWVAALQLAALSLRDSDDPAAIVEGFSGRHHAIADYLAENILDALPPEMLDFLFATSICDRICAGLATTLSGWRRGQTMLEELERRDLFLRALDDEREWFRFHQLFATYLRRRLERDQPERVVTLHRAASAWFAEHGLLSDAVTHALAAGDDSGAVDLVERESMKLAEHSRMGTLLGLVSRLPKALLAPRPRLQMAIAWANCLQQRARPAQLALNQVRAALSPADEESREILGEADVVQACIDAYGDRLDTAAALVRPYIVDDPPYRALTVAVAANVQTFVDIHTFRYENARERQRRANIFHAKTQGPFAGVYGQCLAGLAAFSQLDLIGAERSYREAAALARSAAGRHSHAARLASALLGQVHYERDDLDTAERLLEDCHQLGAESGVTDFMIVTYATLARIKACQGDADEAWTLLDEGEAAAAQLGLDRLSAAVLHERVRLHTAQGEIDRAADLLGGRDVVETAGTDGVAMASGHYLRVARARLLAAQGSHPAATELLSAVLQESAAAGWPRAEAVARIELASVLRLAGKPTEAAAILAPTLAVAARAGIVRSVLDGGHGVVKVVGDLRDARRCRRWPPGLPEVPFDYLSRLLEGAQADTRRGAGTRMPRHSGRAILEEPLSPREVEILRLLDRGLSNREIARNLALAVNTVKWYLKAIYVKLGVTRRQQAVAEARRCQILA